MEWTTHMLSGTVAGYMITGGDLRGAFIGGLAGVIPDMDEHKSKFGRLLYPISYPLNKLVGHRSLTHSLLFVFMVGMIFWPFSDFWFCASLMAGIIAHIVGDMLTGKVKLFYPAQKVVGFSVSPLMFTLIDRTAAVLLIGYICRELLKTFV
ncbi:metal-dependent hydrolase [Oceanobacillus damuensis]|uniref:metal-dependent hydrolase n=1 Tax=Oceanobacillus damuensis TaxID=937928 RepID=UPI0008344DC2|nr:metal-dependent hydrolase [Oceanobacillus damuensis]